jgi:hypothetical protein
MTQMERVNQKELKARMGPGRALNCSILAMSERDEKDSGGAE